MSDGAAPAKLCKKSTAVGRSIKLRYHNLKNILGTPTGVLHPAGIARASRRSYSEGASEMACRCCRLIFC